MKGDKCIGRADLKSEPEKKIHKMQPVKDFWGRLSKQMIKKLYTVYKIDFEMFQYGYPQEYIDMGY